MIKQFILLLILSLGFTQDEYPYFSDPGKQLQFEKNRIFIIEKEYQEKIQTGGGSYIELANAWGTLFGEDPDYVSMNHPIETRYEYYYESKYTTNNIKSLCIKL